MRLSTRTIRWGAGNNQIHHDAFSVLDAGFSALDAVSERDIEKESAVKTWKRLKRIGRYPVGRPRCGQRFPVHPEVQSLTMKVHSDFAGCKETRLSISCRILMRDKHVLGCSTSTQRIQPLSSGETEFMTPVRLGSIGFGAEPKTLGSISPRIPTHRQPKVLLREWEWGRYFTITHHCYGCSGGWRIASGWKWRGTENEVDIGTKLLSGDMLDRILESLKFVFEAGMCE